MKKFEYKTHTFAYPEGDNIAQTDIKALNALGAQGWEVVSVVPVKLWKANGGMEDVVAILKREIEK